MTWLIRLYPPAWRRRYGRELAELIATQPASFSTAIDLVAGHGPNVTAVDSRKAAAVTIAGTLALVIPLLWAMARYGSNPYLESLLSMSWLVPVIYSQRYTSLKERPGRVQAVLIGGPAAFVIAIALATAWISART